MKPPTGNKRLLFALVAALALAVVLALLSILPAKRGVDARKADETEIEGVDLTYLSFNKNNEKKLEVKCRESQKMPDGRLFMKKITATIFKADKLDKDIHVSADAGYTRNEFNEFFLQGNALITSPSFTLSGNSFDLKNMDILSTEEEVDFKLRDVAGRAKKGMLYIFQSKYLKLFRPKGVLRRSGRAYRFKAQVIRVLNQKNILHLDKHAQMVESETIIRGNRISLQFDKDFVNLERAEAIGRGYFQTVETGQDGMRHGREIRANQIKMFNDPQGRLQKIAVVGAGEVSLVNGKDVGRIRSGAIEISLNSETQALEAVRTLDRGTLTSTGKENLQVSGDSFLALYTKKGDLASILAEKKCSFRTADFNGLAEKIHYDFPQAKIDISGRNSSVASGKNTFFSNRFLIHTRTRQLLSDQKVKATLNPGKKGVLLGARPLFVTASGLEMSDGGKLTRFKGDVSLYQDEIEMHAGELLFESGADRIACRGDAALKFPEGGETVELRGDAIAFDPAAAKIVIEGQARLRQGPNSLSARRIELAFDRADKLENVDAVDRVTFAKKDLTGKAQLLHWQYARKTIQFKNSAEITRQGSGTTRGQQLDFDLESNEITVSGSGERSQTTMRQDRP